MKKSHLTSPYLGPFFLAAALFATLIKISPDSNLLWRLSLLLSLLFGVFITLLNFRKEPELPKTPLPVQVKEPEKEPEEESQQPFPMAQASEEEPGEPEYQAPIEKDENLHKYLQLRRQFDEKSHILKQTRRELFYTENELLTLQKECEQSALEENEFSKPLTACLNEVEVLQEEVDSLQAIISHLLAKKKPVRPRKKKKTGEVEDFLSSIMK